MICQKCGYEHSRVNFCPKCKIQMYPAGSTILKKKSGIGFVEFLNMVFRFIFNVILRIVESIAFSFLFYWFLYGLIFGLEFIAKNVESDLAVYLDIARIPQIALYGCYIVITFMTFKYRWPKT